MIGPVQAVESAKADSLRAVLDSVFAEPAYQWTRRRHPLGFLGEWWDQLTRWLTSLQDQHPVAFHALTWALLVVLLMILAHGAWVLIRTMHAAERVGVGGGPAPGPPPRGAEWYRREAARLAGAGRFTEAMQHDFLALVLDLDTRRVVRFHPSKTPSEYSQEARLTDQGRQAFRQLVGQLYRHAFAGLPSGPDDYAVWQSRLTEERYAAAH